MDDRKQYSTNHPMMFTLINVSDHITSLTGASPRVEISRDGAALIEASGAVSEIGSGIYALAGHAWDRSVLGEFALYAQAANADPVNKYYNIVASDPYDQNFSMLLTTSNFAAMAELTTLPSFPVNPLTMLEFIYQWHRHKITSTSGMLTLWESDSITPLTSGVLSDDGTTFTRKIMS